MDKNNLNQTETFYFNEKIIAEIKIANSPM